MNNKYSASSLLVLNYKWIGIRGILSIVMGFLGLISPMTTLSALVLVASAYLIFDGFFTIFSGLRQIKRDRSENRADIDIRNAHPSARRWMFPVIQGIITVAVGVIALRWPAATLTALSALLGIWFVIRGVFEIASAVELRRVIHGEWLLALSGVLSTLVGLAIIAFPVVGFFTMVGLLSAYLLLDGFFLLALSQSFKKKQHLFGPRGGADDFVVVRKSA